MFDFKESMAEPLLQAIRLLFTENNEYDREIKYENTLSLYSIHYDKQIQDFVLLVVSKYPESKAVYQFSKFDVTNRKSKHALPHSVLKTIFLFNPSYSKKLQENYKFYSTTNTEKILEQLV